MIKTLGNLIITDGTLKLKKEMIQFNFQSPPCPDVHFLPALPSPLFFLGKAYDLRE